MESVGDQTSEIESVSSDSPLQQGDIVFWPHRTEFLEIAGVVVTADCDLARGKHWGRISVVPIFGLSTYVEELLAPRLLARSEQKLKGIFGQEITRALRGREESPSSEALDQLIGTEHLPLSLQGNRQVELMHQILRQCRGLQKYSGHLECFGSALGVMNPGKNLLQSSIKNALLSLPGDVMPVPHVEGLPFEIAVAWLRILREIREENIVTKMSLMSPETAIRIGRFSPVVRYRLTQMLAQVFSDIGLPERHEQVVRAQIDGYVLTIGQG